MIPLRKVAEVIASLNKEDETIKIEDDLPSVEDVVEKEIEEAEVAEEGVVFHGTVTSDPKDFDKATVEKLDTPEGELVLITIPHHVDGQTVEEAPVDEIGDLADEAAEEIVDDLAEGDAVESESEEEAEPVKKRVCERHTIDGQSFDLRDLATTEEEGYYSRVVDLDGKPAEGWLQWNYCDEFEPGRYSRYYSTYYGDATITDTNFIENARFDPAEGLTFEMETSKQCDTDKSAKFKFITHLQCDQGKFGPLDWEDTSPSETAPKLGPVWYEEPCEYHVTFAHRAGCALDPRGDLLA